MSIKLKALGLGLLAVMAMGAVAAMNASATVSGHFTSSVNTTTLTAVDTVPNHHIELSVPTLSADKLHCSKVSYHGHVTGTTVTEVTITPTYKECTTTNSGNVLHINMNGCAYIFYSRAPVAGKDATVKLECPAGKKADVVDTGTGCTLEFGEQTLEGLIYDTDTTEGKKHSVTLTITFKGIKFTAHSGICIFVGTNQTGGQIEGSSIVIGKDTLGNEVDITAT